jgi:hypothetical protein
VRIAGSVDGNAYYWSSVNPSTFHGYVEKLTDMGRECTRERLWIAPHLARCSRDRWHERGRSKRRGDLGREIDGGGVLTGRARDHLLERVHENCMEPSVQGWTARMPWA